MSAALEHLDVGGNPLTSLDGIGALRNLRILFATGCSLGPTLPAGGELSTLPKLRMLSVKENGLACLDAAALPPGLVWLIAAQNAISAVLSPERLSGVRKLMLSHNCLSAEAVEALVPAIPALEMLRLANNKLEALPPARLKGRSTVVVAGPAALWCAPEAEDEYAAQG